MDESGTVHQPDGARSAHLARAMRFGRNVPKPRKDAAGAAIVRLRRVADLSTPESRLAFAVVERGVVDLICVVDGDEDTEIERTLAANWMTRSSSFVFWCRAASLDPDWVIHTVTALGFPPAKRWN